MFIDRDGTINRDVPYCSRAEDFELLPGVGRGIKRLNEMGFKVVAITNQSGIARRYFTEEVLASIHDHMRRELAEEGAYIDAIYYCPHHPDDNCECRKPRPKMVLQAASDLNIALEQSYVIGGSEKDMQMAKKAGCKAVLITRVAKGSSYKGEAPEFIAASFLEAVNWVIGDSRQILARYSTGVERN